MAQKLVRFTGSANDALRLGEQEASRLGDGFVGVDHLLVGLMREQMGMAGIILRKSGMKLSALEAAIAPARGDRGREQATRRLDLSPAAKRAINRGVLLAAQAGTQLVGTEHLLLGLISQPEGRAVHLLQRLGLSPEQVRVQLQQALDDPRGKPATPASLEEDSLAKRYNLEAVVGVGSNSTVYRAQDLRFKDMVRMVAIKEMRLSTGDEAERAGIITSFQEEAALLASLKHPFIPRFYEFLSHADRLYIVMEFIDGQDLEAILSASEEFLAVDQVIGWAIQLCDVLTYLHNQETAPIIFRDLKPSNVMIDRQRNVRLIDFNIARVFETGRVRSSVGTTGYSPPEQYHGEISTRVDIYALGATLHHLLTRQDPRFSPEFSFDQRPVRAYNPEVSSALEEIIGRAVAYQPESRFSTVEGMRQALLDCLTEQAERG